MKILGIVLLLIILLLLIAEVIIVHYFVKMVTRPKVNPAEKQYERLIEKGCLKREVYETCEVEKEKFLLPSQYGYSLYCELLTTEASRRPENRSRVAIMCHGFTSCLLYTSIPRESMWFIRYGPVIPTVIRRRPSAIWTAGSSTGAWPRWRHPRRIWIRRKTASRFVRYSAPTAGRKGLR